VRDFRRKIINDIDVLLVRVLLEAVRLFQGKGIATEPIGAGYLWLLVSS
jgi:hypothetical protein